MRNSLKYGFYFKIACQNRFQEQLLAAKDKKLKSTLGHKSCNKPAFLWTIFFNKEI